MSKRLTPKEVWPWWCCNGRAAMPVMDKCRRIMRRREKVATMKYEERAEG